ncbi:hypothetical protein CPT_Moonbeam152 [Bacillus phage Moonbeam]|uniref:Uncharacterized protein n=1 Tax=Bacillus phage Moonbeam TaxID=1540091 RepID=A0A0A0RN89_9CAUD|nr:hypothetical protein CPT_Moonbeam152 [Bacillus phage Moonbeam]AIW03550.1 hypothetical protein CPT_Moonbeam152 [Bacillus phage Moonbeam]
MEHLNLVKYAGDYWVTLSSATSVRNTAGYSNLASVKSAIRTFSIKEDPSNYVAFRGEQQIKNIAQENITNPLFNPEEFKGVTRTGLINFQIMGVINERFAVDSKYANSVKQFMKDADEFIRKDRIATNEVMKSDEDINSSSLITSRSIVLKQLRAEVNQLDKTIQTAQDNKAKLLQAINSLETLSLVDMH